MGKGVVAGKLRSRTGVVKLASFRSVQCRFVNCGSHMLCFLPPRCVALRCRVKSPLYDFNLRRPPATIARLRLKTIPRAHLANLIKCDIALASKLLARDVNAASHTTRL